MHCATCSVRGWPKGTLPATISHKLQRRVNTLFGVLFRPQAEALRAELDSRGASERQSAAAALEAEVQVRVAAQAAADAQLLCSLRCQLQEAREELESANADLREAEGLASAREEDVAGLRRELGQLQRALEQHRTQRQQEQRQLEEGGTGSREEQQAAMAEEVRGAGAAAGVAERLMGQVLALVDGGAAAGAEPPRTSLGPGSGRQGDRTTRLQGLLGLLDQLRRLTGGHTGAQEEERSSGEESDADSHTGDGGRRGGGLRLPEDLCRQLGSVLGDGEPFRGAWGRVGGTDAQRQGRRLPTDRHHVSTYQLLLGDREGGAQLRHRPASVSGDEVNSPYQEVQLHRSRHRPSRSSLASTGGRCQQRSGHSNSMTSCHGTDSSASDSAASSSTSRSASSRTRRSAPIRRSRGTCRMALLAAGPGPSGAVPPDPAQPVPPRADAACQVDASCPGLQPLLPLSRLSAVAAQLASTQQQHGELTSAVAALRVQAAEAEALVAVRTSRVAELQAGRGCPG